MPAGKSPILLNDLMAEGDNNKHIIFNNALVALEDALNRALTVDLSAAGVTLTETQITRFGVFICTGHTVTRTLLIPQTLTASLFPVNRVFAVRNVGTGAITVSHGVGTTVNVPAASTALVYANGTDIISLGGVSNNATIPVSEDGATVATAVSSFNFTGNAVNLTNTGGAITITINSPQTMLDLTDVPDSLAGHGGKSVVVKADLTGFEFVRTTMTNAEVKAAYEANANTNAFTDAEKTKLAGIEPGATADMTAAEIKAAYESNANTNAFTDAEKTKLAGLEASTFKGTYTTDTALAAAHPTSTPGAYAYVDAGAGASVVLYIWDANDNQWVGGGSGGSTETSASIKTKYEANPNTNAFTDAEKAKLAGVETGATADMTGAEIVTAINGQLGGTTWQAGGVTVEDEGTVVLSGATRMNFVGANVSVADAGGGEVTVTVSGSGGGAIAVEDEGTEIIATMTRINFAGTGVTVTDAGGGEATITIPGAGGTASPLSIVTATGAHTVTNANLGGNVILKVNSATAVSVTVPSGLTGIEALTIIGTGLGDVTIVGAGGVTILSADGNNKLRARYSSATLIPDGANNYLLIGDLV